MKKKTLPIVNSLPATTPAPAGQLVFIPPAQLKTHPRNMRRIYPQADVCQMAESIRALGGLIQPLRVVPDGAPNTFYVADGNLRLAAARYLGAHCPPLKCEVITNHAQVEQMLDMIIANTIRFDPDPISEALHYAALHAEGLTYLQICERTGQYYQRVLNRLRLLDLDEPIRDLISRGEFPHDLRVVNALLSVPDVTARVQLARKLSAAKAKISIIVSACAKLKARLEQASAVVAAVVEPQPASPPAQPMLALAQARTKTTEPQSPVTAPSIRAAARAMCSACAINSQQLAARFPEPAWTLIAQHAGQVCGHCNLRELNVCADCPGVELLSQLLKGKPA